MSFFDITPERGRPRWGRSGRPIWSRPEGVIPGVTHLGLILIRTEGMAVAVSSLAAYPNGFEFSVHAVLHHEQFTWGKSPLDPSADRAAYSDSTVATDDAGDVRAAHPRPGGRPRLVLKP